MPPANILWTEPLVQDVDLYASNNIVVRRLTPKSKADPCSPIHNCESGCYESLDGSPGRPGNHQRRRKRTNSRQLFPSRAINAAFWLVILLGVLYYRKMVHTSNFSWGQVKQGPQIHLGASVASSNINPSSISQQQDHVSRNLQTGSIKLDEHIVHIIHTRYETLAMRIR